MIEWPENDEPIAEHEEKDRPGGGGAGASGYLIALAILIASILFISLTH